MLVMMVDLGVELFVIVSVFWCSLVRSYFSTELVTDDTFSISSLSQMFSHG